MKRTGWFTVPAVTLAMTGLALPQITAAELPTRPTEIQRLPIQSEQPLPGSDLTASPSAHASSTAARSAATGISDIALDNGGVLHGQVVDPQGIPLANVDVSLAQQDRVVCTARTDQNGHFAITGLAGGVYQVTGANGEAVYRVWAPRTAPPAAQPAAMLVSGQQLIRAQGAGNGLRRFFTSPWVLAGMLGAAIIVPIALNNRDKVPYELTL